MANVSKYALYVVDNSAKGAVVINIANDLTSTYVPSTALTPGHNYTWYVGSVSNNGSSVVYDTSAPITFTVAPLAAPVPVAPTAGTIAANPGYDTPTFSWNAVTGAASYELYVVDVTNKNTAVINTNVVVTSYTGTTLTPSHTFTWYIAAVSTNGMSTVYDTSPVTFTLAALSASAPTSPANGSTIVPAAGYDTPTFTWSPVNGTTRYRSTCKTRRRRR